MAERRTLAAAAAVAGRGLFTGLPSAVRILPAASGGIRVRRTDVAGVEYPATVGHVTVPPNLPGRNTCLASAEGAAPVLTVEHVLSALAGLGITDAVLEVEGYEIPIGDGSALPFLEAVRAAGVAGLPGEIEPLVITREIELSAGGGVITATPRTRAGCLYRYELDYGGGSPIGAQSAEIEIGNGSAEYERGVAPARTFCLESEARAMQAAGLFRHLSPRDMLVIGAGGPIDNALRFENEPARHKLLDLIGDLALVGRPIAGAVVAKRAGHALNHEMARALLAAFG